MVFSDQVLQWHALYGRKHLPWQQKKDPYPIWVSEIMLQQTQVNTVIPYFTRFMEQFPNVESLASASDDHVMQFWAGLGYYSRARNLHKAAKTIVSEHAGQFPQTLSQLEALSGIGRSTAAAILSLAFDQQQPILDGNVKRVLARYHAVEGWPGKSAVLKQLWEYAELHVPESDNAAYTQAMMDMGATLCTRSKPKCDMCPINTGCQAYQQKAVGEYPYPKPKKVLPERHTLMLLIKNTDGEIALFKRPSYGIWGGLWSFPEFDNQEIAAEWFSQHYNDDFIPELLPVLPHTFSHYRLVISPLLVEMQDSRQCKRIMEADQQLWYNSDNEFSGGIPAPIKTLLKRITS